MPKSHKGRRASRNLHLPPPHRVETSGQLQVPAALPPEKKALYSRIGSWVGLIAGVDALEKRNVISRDKNRTYIPL
jgi:hypothetical protein